MIVGLITIVGLLVIRVQQTPPTPTLPDTITLPAGVTPGAVTFGPGWVAVVAGDAILIYDATTGALRQTVAITH